MTEIAMPRTIGWALLASLPDVERDRLIARTRRRRYARNAILVREGDQSDSLHLVEEGRLAVRVDTAAGDTAMLNVIGPGDWFGELRERHPATGELLLTLLSRRVDELSSRLVEVMYDSLDRRVHRRLLDLVRVYGDGDPARSVTVPLAQEQLAGLVGGTRPSVNEVLQKLARRGVVELGRGRIIVHRPGALIRRAS